MGVEELVGGDVILGELKTDIRFSQTGPNFLPTPRTSDAVPQPRGESVKPVLPVPSTGNIVATVGSCNDEGENKDNEEDSDEECHGEEVKCQETLFVPVGTDETGEGDEEDKDADYDNGPPDVGDALVVWLRC